MIYLDKLRWDNCFSYGANNEVNLAETRLTQIVGLNGTGKSSIPLILEEVLYGKNSKGVKKGDIANRLVNSGYSIYLRFFSEGSCYEVDYTRKGATAKVKLLCNGEDISSHTSTATYVTLQGIIGLDFKTFSQLVYQNTNTSLQFLTATDTTRKKFLIDLLSLEHYSEYFEVFKSKSKTTNDEVQLLEGQKRAVESWLAENQLDIEEELSLHEIPEINQEDLAYSKYLDSKITIIEQTNSSIRRNNQYKELLKAININDSKAYINSNTLFDESEATEHLGSIRSSLANSKSIIAKIENLKDTCYACGQSIDISDQLAILGKEKQTYEKLSKEYKEAKEKLDLIKESNSTYTNHVNKVKEWEELYRSIDHSLPIDLEVKETLQQELTELNSKIKELKKQIQTLTAKNEQIKSHNAQVKLVKSQKASMLAKRDAISNELSSKIEELKYLEVLKKAFSTNGLVAYKIENLVKDLEDLTNQYLAELSGGRFTLQFVINNDKLNVDVTDNGTSVDIMSLSSGELARVNTSTLLAIRRLMASISRAKINVLFLDEVINVLDEGGREKLVEVLLEEDLNTFLVSHQWEHPLLEKMHIIKHGGVSRIEGG
jgi:DNA repair exonuclease SbcCD ATPase subunit